MRKQNTFFSDEKHIPKQQMRQGVNLFTVQYMKIYHSTFLLPFDKQNKTVRHFFRFGLSGIYEKNCIFANIYKNELNEQRSEI